MSENPILSAALEDAEGHALVEKILVERVTNCMANGLHAMGKGTCNSCGVTPKPFEYTRRLNSPSSMKVLVDGEWKDVTGTVSVDIPIPEVEVFREPGRLLPKKMSASVQMQMQDTSYEFMAMLLGYNCVAEMQEEARKREELAATVDDVLSRRIDAPPVDVDKIRWAPLTHRLYARRDAKTSVLHRILGIEET